MTPKQILDSFSETLMRDERILSTSERALVATLLQHAKAATAENPETQESVRAVIASAVGETVAQRAFAVLGGSIVERILEGNSLALSDSAGLRTSDIYAGPKTPGQPQPPGTPLRTPGVPGTPGQPQPPGTPLRTPGVPGTPGQPQPPGAPLRTPGVPGTPGQPFRELRDSRSRRGFERPKKSRCAILHQWLHHPNSRNHRARFAPLLFRRRALRLPIGLLLCLRNAWFSTSSWLRRN